MSAPREYSSAESRRLVQLYRTGISAEVVAERMGHGGREAVLNELRRRSEPVRPRGFTPDSLDLLRQRRIAEYGVREVCEIWRLQNRLIAADLGWPRLTAAGAVTMYSIEKLGGMGSTTSEIHSLYQEVCCERLGSGSQLRGSVRSYLHTLRRRGLIDSKRLLGINGEKEHWLTDKAWAWINERDLRCGIGSREAVEA